jgi:hypothetical protein
MSAVAEFWRMTVAPSVSEILLQDIREIDLTAEAGKFAFPVLMGRRAIRFGCHSVDGV